MAASGPKAHLLPYFIRYGKSGLLDLDTQIVKLLLTLLYISIVFGNELCILGVVGKPFSDPVRERTEGEKYAPGGLIKP